MSNTGWYSRKNQFSPYTIADGRAVTDELDAIQASFERIPTMRDDGNGFVKSPIIPEPTEDFHPVQYGQFKNGVDSITEMKKVVEQKAAQVEVNTGAVAVNTVTAVEAKDIAVASAESAKKSAESASKSEQIARAGSETVTVKAEEVAINTQTVIDKADEAKRHAKQAVDSAYAGGFNPATKERAGVVKLSDDEDSDSEETVPTSKTLARVNNNANSRLSKTGDILTGALECEHIGKGSYAQQYDTKAPFFVTSKGSSKQDTYHPFVKGHVRTAGDYGAAFSLGYTSYQALNRPHHQFGRGVLCLNEDNGREIHWEFDHDGIIYGKDFHAYGVGTMSHLRDQIFSVNNKADEALLSSSVGWYPHHYDGAHTFRNLRNHQLITVMNINHAQRIAQGQFLFNLPEKYNGFAVAVANAWAHSVSVSERATLCQIEGNGTQVRVHAEAGSYPMGFRIVVIGYY